MQEMAKRHQRSKYEALLIAVPGQPSKAGAQEKTENRRDRATAISADLPPQLFLSQGTLAVIQRQEIVDEKRSNREILSTEQTFSIVASTDPTCEGSA